MLFWAFPSGTPPGSHGENCRKISFGSSRGRGRVATVKYAVSSIIKFCCPSERTLSELKSKTLSQPGEGKSSLLQPPLANRDGVKSEEEID